MRKIFLAGFVLSMAWSASAQTLSFRVTDIPIGTSGGSGIRVADFNNDGIPDIATLGAGYIGSVAIVLGNGDGTFKSPLYVPTQQSQTGFSISDLNLDGNMDLVVNEVDTNGNYGIYVYLGKGDGTFRIPIHVGSGSFGFVGGDFNGDGKPDLIVSTTGSSTASIAFGNGDGTFKAPSQSIPSLPRAVFDINADGKLDIVIQNNDGFTTTFQVLLGNGDGTFRPAGSVPVYYTDENGGILTIGDLNGDGKPDFVICEGDGVKVFLGRGDGTFQDSSFYPTTVAGYFTYGVAIGDANGDGKPDLIVVGGWLTPNGFVWVLPGNGDGTFGSVFTFPLATLPSSVATSDFNRDNKLDLVVRTYTGTSVLINTQNTEVSLTLTPSPTGMEVSVDSVPCFTPCNTSFNAGTSHTIAVLPQAYQAGPQFAFSNWSDSGAQTHQITLSAASATYNAVFKTQFQLTTSVSPPGAGSVMTPGSGYLYHAGSTQVIQAIPAPGYQFASWSGPVANLGQSSTSVTMEAPKSVTAFFTTLGTPTGGLLFMPLKPCRVSDTRNPAGSFGGPRLGAHETRSISIVSSACGVPSTAAAYSLNVTAVPAGPLSYLTLWPTSQSQPLVSTLNSLDGRVKANAAIVPAGAGGAVSVFVTDPSDVVLDINGYFVPVSGANGLSFYPVTPCRIADTRNATGPFGAPSISAGGTRTFLPDQSTCNLPPTAQAYSLNFTVVPKTSLSFLTVWPFGQNQPLVSTLNSPTGAIVANAAIVSAGTNFGINAYATDTTDVIVDVNGYFAPPGALGALSFYTVSPCRMLDTRSAPGVLGGPVISANQTRTYPLLSSACGISGNAKAYSLNATVVPWGSLGYLSLWPAEQPQPLVSTLNAIDGAITGNAAIVPAGAGGTINAFVTSNTDLILDIAGYFAP
jgi:hypothetical protein